jgi:uncharacterized protein YydD (DUF2326 family)
MITLNCIYSETRLFDRVVFHPGINIILGKYPSDERNTDGKRSVNGIGKSTLVRLIDFALLSSPGQGALNPKTYPFLQDHNVVLEITIDEVIYRIVRSFENPSTVHFGRKDESLVEYTKLELREVLGNKFFMSGTYPGGYYTNTWFRELIKFFVKDDIGRRGQDTPINFLARRRGVRKAQLLTYNFFLLGLPNEHLYDYGNVQVQSGDKATARRELERQIEQETGKPISEFRTEVAKFKERVTLLETSLQEFEFLETYKDVEERLVEIARLISEQLGRYHAYRKTLERYAESYRVEIEVSVEKVRALYEDVDRDLGTFVEKTLDEVIQFRREIAENRRRFLTDKERELEGAISQVMSDITALERKRQKLYNLLQEKGAFDSIRHTYEQLIEEKVDLERSSAKLTQLLEMQSSIAKLRLRLSELTSAIIEDIRASQEQINALRLLYKEILENAIFVDKSTQGGYLDVQEDSSKRPPIDIIVNVPKSESLGKYQFSLLAYDLTVFFSIIRSGRRLPHFLIHDGVFHSIARKTVVNVLNHVYQQSLANSGFQYIITGNEDEFEIPPSERSLYQYHFDFDKVVVVTYEATPEKMIFKREF